MSGQRYTWQSMLLHWVQAALVLWLLWLGWTMVDLPKGPGRGAAYGLHKSLGLLVLLLSLARLLWRRRHPAPPALGGGWEAKLAKGVHHGLYAFLLLAPLAGFLTSAFTPNPIKFFGLELPRLFAPDDGLNGFFKQCHWVLVWTGALLVVLHVVGAMKHALSRDGTMQRMLPGWLLRG